MTLVRNDNLMAYKAGNGWHLLMGLPRWHGNRVRCDEVSNHDTCHRIVQSHARTELARALRWPRAINVAIPQG